MKIVDGDTLDISCGRIRLALTNTPEQGDEGFTEATNFAKDLCPVGSEITIDEDSGQTSGSYGRIVAVVYCNDRNLNAELLSEELAVVDTRFCDESEFANEEWAASYCTPSEPPSSSCTTVTEFHYDAEGNDNYNLNDEYVTLKNTCASFLNMTMWKVSDERGYVYTFPTFILDSQASVTLYTGSGTDTATVLYWGRTSAIWNNNGDTLHLRDSSGSLLLKKSY